MHKRMISYNHTVLVLIILFSSLLVYGCTDGGIKYDFYGYVSLNENLVQEGEIVSMEKIEEMIEIELETWFFTSGVPNNLIKVKYHDSKDREITFDCIPSEGKFWWQNKYVDKATIKPNDIISWHPKVGDISNEKIYIDIVIKKDKNIIGYAVIEIKQVGVSMSYTANVIKNAVFPKINGKYQKITDARVADVIKKIKSI